MLLRQTVDDSRAPPPGTVEGQQLADACQGMALEVFDVLMLGQALQVQGQGAEGLQQARVIKTAHGCSSVGLFLLFSSQGEGRSVGLTGQGLGRVSALRIWIAIVQMQDGAGRPVGKLPARQPGA